MSRRVIGFLNPDGSGRGNWSHASDADEVIGHLQHYHTRKGRVLKLARYRSAPRYQATPSPDGPGFLELVAGVLVLLIWFGAIFWALPILAEAVMR